MKGKYDKFDKRNSKFDLIELNKNLKFNDGEGEFKEKKDFLQKGFIQFFDLEFLCCQMDLNKQFLNRKLDINRKIEYLYFKSLFNPVLHRGCNGSLMYIFYNKEFFIYCNNCNVSIANDTDDVFSECESCKSSIPIKLNYNHLILKVLIKENKFDLSNITFQFYHCQLFKDEPLQCIDCGDELFINNDFKRIICISCLSIKDSTIEYNYICKECSHPFESKLKRYDSEDKIVFNQIIKLTIKYKILAKPLVMAGKNVNDFCGCVLSFKDKFQHNSPDECNGLLYKGELEETSTVVCSECKYSTLNKWMKWTCPLCNISFTNEEYIEKTNKISNASAKEQSNKLQKASSKFINKYNLSSEDKRLDKKIDNPDINDTSIIKVLRFDSKSPTKKKNEDEEDKNSNEIRENKKKHENQSNHNEEENEEEDEECVEFILKRKKHLLSTKGIEDLGQSSKNLNKSKSKTETITMKELVININHVVEEEKIDNNITKQIQKEEKEKSTTTLGSTKTELEITSKKSNKKLNKIEEESSSPSMSKSFYSPQKNLQKSRAILKLNSYYNEDKSSQVIEEGPISPKKLNFINNNHIHNKKNETSQLSSQSSILRPMNSVSILTIKTKSDKKLLDIKAFNIIKQIGEGTFAKIYKVEEKTTGTIYALKKFVGSSKEDLTGITSEYELLNRLNHKNIIKIYGTSSMQLDNTTYVLYILMEYASCDWYSDIIKRIPKQKYYKETEIWNIIKQIICAFSFLQRENLCHRDVKPQNILMFNDDSFKLCDFGEAKKIISFGQETIRGSELYMSPILFDGLQSKQRKIKHNTFKSDVFSLGMSFLLGISLNFDILCVVRKNETGNYHIKIEENLKSNDYSKALIDFINSMLELNEEKRPDFIMLENMIYKLDKKGNSLYTSNNLNQSKTYQNGGQNMQNNFRIQYYSKSFKK